MSERTYTTEQAAKAVGISRQTLQAWIAAGKVKAPRMRLLHRVGARLWTEADLARLRQAKDRIYLKEMGRPRKKK